MPGERANDREGKGAGCKSGGGARKAFELTSGDLPRVVNSRLGTEGSMLTQRQKSAEGILAAAAQ